MGEGAKAAGIGRTNILRRVLSYARSVLQWEPRLNAVRDPRRRPRIATRVILRAAVGTFLSRLGSLNALEQTRPSRFWRGWLGEDLPSADSIGRVRALMDVDDLRNLPHAIYAQLKRIKALPPPALGLMAAVLDGPVGRKSRRPSAWSAA